MNAVPEPLPGKALASAVRRRLLIGWLPIIGVGLLIFWLSGGVPPTALILLIQMVSRWSALQASMGSGVWLPFSLVLLQCIMICVAWGILAFTIWSEISAMNTMQAQQRIVRLQEAAAAPQTPQVETLQVLQETTSSASTVQLMPEEPDEDLPGGLFDEEDETASTKNTEMQIVANDDTDLFDASNAIFELSSESDEPEAETENVSAQLQPLEEEETVFVYGNPFDGELPDVFRYDMDLKRGVQDMQDEISNKKRANEEKVEGGEEKLDTEV